MLVTAPIAPIRGWLALATFALFCCGNTDPEVAQAPWMQTANPPLAMDPSPAAADDFFGCVVPPAQSPDFPAPLSCARPLIPSRCRETTDFDRIRTAQRSREFIVLSLHGGHIAQNTSAVGDRLAQEFNWDRYDFQGHGTWGCLRGATNRQILYISATHFNDPAALALVRSHTQAVAIDGNPNLTGAARGTLCVGGLNGAARDQFIRSLQKSPMATHLPFRLTLVDATKNPAFPCKDSTGIELSNPVNLGENGGLQLALSAELLAELAASHPGPRTKNLQLLFSSAVNEAIHQQ